MALAVRLFGGLIGAVCIAIVAILALQSSDQARRPPVLTGLMGEFTAFDPPQPVPTIAFINGADEPMGLGAFAGQVVLVNFWATWCGPCVREMPALDRLEARLGGDNFHVVPISLDRRGVEKVVPFFERHELGNLGVFIDRTGASMRAFGVSGLPTTFLIGRDGTLLGRLEGPAEWDAADAEALIRYYLDRGSD